jgi:ABC-type bacteriocin/lantibiotic exporter with double-glycine peptidase domain
MELLPLVRFWKLLKPFKIELGNLYTYAIFNGLVSLSLPLGIQAIINLIQGGAVSTAWIVLVCLVVFGIAVSGILQIYQLRITEYMQQRIFANAAFEFSFRIPKIKMEALYPHYPPELMNRFFDILTVQKGLPKILIDFLTAALQVVFGLLLLSFYHPFFILFSLVLIILVYVIFRFTARKGMRTSLEESKYKYKAVFWLEEVARSASAFKLSGSQVLALEKTDALVMEYINARKSHFKVLIQQYSLMVVFKVIIATGLLALGGMLVMNQLMNVGQFVAAEIIILLVMSSVEKLNLVLEVIYDVLTGLEKVGQVTDMELESDSGSVMAEVCSTQGVSIDLNDVYFTYPTKKNWVLNGLNLSIAEGEKVQILGNNGSGKSTLLQVMAGLYEVDKGSICYNGLPKGNINLQTLRIETGDFLNHQTLFHGTLKENITMGRAIDINRLKEIAEVMGLTSLIQSLPRGFDEPLDLVGIHPHGSHAQKIMLCRSVIHQPKLLLIEHSLDAIEYKERNRIFDYLCSEDKKWTLVIASIEGYIAQKVDTIVKLEQGRVVDKGNFVHMKSYWEA